jgi:hypothetical protein
MVIDDFDFLPYMNDGYQCKVKCEKGIISIRYKGNNLIADEKRPFEVWYPNENSPTGYQTTDDVWNYIKSSVKA